MGTMTEHDEFIEIIDRLSINGSIVNMANRLEKLYVGLEARCAELEAGLTHYKNTLQFIARQNDLRGNWAVKVAAAAIRD